MNKKLLIAVGLAIGLPIVNAKADFASYYAIPSPGPGSVAAIPIGANTLVLGNWSGSAAGVNGLFSRSPDSAANATAFTLTAGANGIAAFEITQPTVAQFTAQALYPKYYFQWNLTLKGTDTAWYTDGSGTYSMSGVGTALFDATPSIGPGALWGFYVDATGNGGVSTEALQIQGWDAVPEPSSIAMGLITCLGAAGFAVRRYQARKS